LFIHSINKQYTVVLAGTIQCNKKNIVTHTVVDYSVESEARAVAGRAKVIRCG